MGMLAFRYGQVDEAETVLRDAFTKQRALAGDSAAVSALLFLSPLTAVLLGWVFLGQSLNAFQLVGILSVVGSIWLSQGVSARS